MVEREQRLAPIRDARRELFCFAALFRINDENSRDECGGLRK